MENLFRNVARKSCEFLGSPFAFGAAISLIFIWAGLGFHFQWSDSHSLFINTITTIITFLAVFLLQNTQNHDTAEIKRKLDQIQELLNSLTPPKCGGCKKK